MPESLDSRLIARLERSHSLPVARRISRETRLAFLLARTNRLVASDESLTQRSAEAADSPTEPPYDDGRVWRRTPTTTSEGEVTRLLGGL